MKIKYGENIIVEEKLNPIEISLNRNMAQGNFSDDGIGYYLFGINPTKIYICDKCYDAIPITYVARLRNDEDGYFRFIYIQINVVTGEYYIGKVNRPTLKELKRYQGSGLKFTNKFNNHREQFIRYYIYHCKTAKETELIESQIVTDKLLKDELCLNLVKGGGGVATSNDVEKKKRLSEYMLNHPEQFKPFRDKNKELFCSGKSHALEMRNKAIKETMNSEKYKQMTRERINKWKKEHPEEYKKARELNKLRIQSQECQIKRKETLKKNMKENPEKYLTGKQNRLKAIQSPEAQKKRKESIREWMEKNPEQSRINALTRSKLSAEKSSKKIEMLDLISGEVLKTFKSIHDGARWLVDNGKANNIKCASSIGAVCMYKPCTTGYGYRKKAYGYGWRYAK